MPDSISSVIRPTTLRQVQRPSSLVRSFRLHAASIAAFVLNFLFAEHPFPPATDSFLIHALYPAFNG